METGGKKKMECGMTRRYLLRYTVIFTVLMLLALLPFWAGGKSLIWKTDGASQYYPYLYYMGNWLRDGLKDLLHGDALCMFDFQIGMGDDIGAIVRFHPLDFLSVLVPGRYTEILYQILVLLRLYLAGLSFSLFGFYWKKPQQAVLTGSLIYIFCGYGLRLVLMHPTFGAPLVVLPLLLLAAERSMRREGGLFLSVVTAVGFISNYYFMYMCSIGLFFYVLLRFFDLYRERRLRSFFRMGFRLAGSYLLGIGMSAVILLPTVLRLVSSERLDAAKTVGNLWLYGKERYLAWFHNLITPGLEMGSNTYLSYTVLVLPALTILYLRKWRDKLTLKLAFFIELVFLLLPAAGWVLSGFNAIGNRWTFLMSFTVSFIFVAVAEDFSGLSRLWAVGLAAVTGAYVLLYLYRFTLQGESSRFVLAGAAELLLCTAVLLICRKRRIGQTGWQRMLLGMVCCSAVLNGWMTYGEKLGNGVQGQTDRGSALSSYTSMPFASYGRIEDTDFWRADTSEMVSGGENASVILGYNGISMYNSIVNGAVLRYLTDQENPGANAVHRIFHLDGRTVPEALANVRYYLAAEEQEVPYGFVQEEEIEGSGYKLYRNEYPLSIGYTYDSYITAESYEKLSALERQQVMREAVVLEASAEKAGSGESKKEADAGKTGTEEADAEEAGLKAQTEAESKAQAQMPAEVEGCSDEILQEEVKLPEKGENLKRTKDGYKAESGGGSIRIPYRRRAGYECYLRLEGFTKNTSYTFVKISTSNLSKEITLRGKTRTYSLGQEDYLINLGWDEEDGMDEITLELTGNGKYGLKGAKLYYVPMAGYAEDIRKLNEEALEEVELENNLIKGKINLTKQKFLTFSVPYSKGWSVYIDGERRGLQRANVMYLGLWLEPGEHTVELRYCTPGLKAGFLISVICFGIFFFWAARKRRLMSKKLRSAAVQR